MVMTENMTDGNASFLRAARSGNVEKLIEQLKGNIDINTSNANGLNALHLAAKEGHVNVVTELLKRGANVNAATKKGNTALHIGSLAGQEEVVRVLIQLGANVNVQSQNGFTPLYMAAQENHDNVVSFLLANGANQSLATEDGFAPLAVALQQGHDKVVAVLLENDTKGRVRLPALHIAAKKDDCKAATLLLQSDHNPDVTSKSGFTPLHIAAHYGNENIARILLNKGADVNYGAKHQITPLHVASKWGKLLMVTLLLEKGADIEASTRDGLTPLHCAARSGHDQVVDLLLEKGAPFLAKTKNGLAPLHMASQGDHVDSARTLLYHKAPVDDVTVDYLTALHVAAHCGHVKVAKLLLDRKADPNARALNGFTPLHIACKKNRIKVVELLLKHGASIEATTESGLTPLHVASFMGCMNIVIYLIQNGANPDVPTVRGETPLHLAARANQTDIIRILLRNGASVDARAREEQTPLHIAARLGNVDIVSLLLQHGAVVDATTKDMYTTLHIAAKEDQEEVAASLMEHGASLTSTTKKGFTPLHLAAKYGNIKVARLLLQKGAPVDAQGKNGVTPLHVAAHYDHVNVALLLLDKGASPHAMAKNGYTPLHIAAKKNQMDIASTLLEYGAKTNSQSKAGFTPLHLSAQEGHAEMSSLLIDHKANVNQKANNGLTPLHLCAQDDRVNVATILAQNGADIGPQTKAGYTPLHVASHFGQINMVRFLLQKDANVHTTTSHGYTALHQAAQQGHTLAVNLLLENQASPNVTTTQGQTPLSIAQRLGYISVVETLKVVTETTIITTTTTVTEEKYKVVAPETMQETFMTDSEDEGGEEAMLGDQSYGYLTADEMKSLGDDSLPIDVTKDEKHHDLMHSVKQFGAPMVEEDKLSPQHATPVEGGFSEKFSPDNVDLSRVPVHAGRLKWKTFLVSFMVDARGGAMRGCRHSGVRVIIPPRKAPMPMRITCRFLRKEKLVHPPPLMEGEACASRILEMGPVAARFLGPVIIEVPHFASTRGKEREITILRSDTGESWREHTLEASEEAVQEVLNESFEGEELSALEDLNTNRITRILTTDFPQYFAIVSRIRQEVHAVGPEGGMVSSTVVPQVQAIFPEGALTKKIRVGLQAQPIAPELVAKLLGNRVAVSPIVTVEPRRRKFHKPITLTIPVPQATTKGMINQYSGDAPTLRLLCSITGSTKSGGTSKAQWEDVTGSTPLTFVNDCVSFTTTVSARFWLMDCRQVNEVSRFATELYQEAVYVPFMSKFVIFAKRYDPYEAQLRVFCMTDDKEDKTLESQENFTEVAKSRDVEVLEGKLQYLEFAGNLAPVTKSGDQLKLTFAAFHENRLPFAIRVKDPHIEPMGRIAFMKEPKTGRGEPPQVPICNLNIALPEVTFMDSSDIVELVTLEKRYDFIQEAGLSKPELIHRADLRLSDIATALDKDWVPLAQQLDVAESNISQIKAEPSCDQPQQALMMLRLWLQKSGSKATGNELEKGLRRINREDVINNCMFNVELVTDDVEKAVAKVHLDQSGFDVFKEELGSSREASIRRGASLDISYDEQDIMKEAESAADTSSETGSLFEKDRISQALTDDKDARLRRASKTPPPTPVDEEDKELKNITKVRNIIITSPFQGKVVDNIKEAFEEDKSQELAGPHGLAARLTESETWPSLEMDTSQVSISSLPYDEKSEPTTATASDSANAPSLETDKIISQGIDQVGADCQILTSCTTETTTHFTSVPSDCLAGGLPVAASPQSEKGEEPSTISPDLSFAEKRDFFQKLSSSSTATPTSTLKENGDSISRTETLVQEDQMFMADVPESSPPELSPEEKKSFHECLKFFEQSSDDVLQTPKLEIKDIKKEVWTVVGEDGKQRLDSVSDIERERDMETIEVCEKRRSTVSIDEQVSLPLYESKEISETVFDSSKDTKVEVMVKTFVPGSEMLEICSLENIQSEAKDSTTTAHQIDSVSESEKVSKIIEKFEESIAGESKMLQTDLPNSSINDKNSEETVSNEEFISKTLESFAEASYDLPRATVDAFKTVEKTESKWQRESPDTISTIKDTMEPSLGKSEIFICTEETLDNVKKILTVADAESNVIERENQATETFLDDFLPKQTGTESEDLNLSSKIERKLLKTKSDLGDEVESQSSVNDSKIIQEKSEHVGGKSMFICSEETASNVKKVVSEIDQNTEILLLGDTANGKLTNANNINDTVISKNKECTDQGSEKKEQDETKFRSTSVSDNSSSEIVFEKVTKNAVDTAVGSYHQDSERDTFGDETYKSELLEQKVLKDLNDYEFDFSQENMSGAEKTVLEKNSFHKHEYQSSEINEAIANEIVFKKVTLGESTEQERMIEKSEIHPQEAESTQANESNIKEAISEVVTEVKSVSLDNRKSCDEKYGVHQQENEYTQVDKLGTKESVNEEVIVSKSLRHEHFEYDIKKPEVAELETELSQANTSGTKEVLFDKIKVATSTVQENTSAANIQTDVFMQSSDDEEKILTKGKTESSIMEKNPSELKIAECHELDVNVNDETIYCEEIIHSKEYLKGTSLKLDMSSKDEIFSGSAASLEEKSDSCLSSLKDQSIEVEFLPYLEMSGDVSKVSVDVTGHEALGTPCSFHKEMEFDDKDIRECAEEMQREKMIQEFEKHSTVQSSEMVEKADYESVEKTEQSNLEKIMYKTDKGKSGKETVQSVEVTEFKEECIEVYNVPSEKLVQKFSSKKIQIESSADSQNRMLTMQKMNQFLDSVTQQDSSLPSDVTPVHKRTEEWLDQSDEILMREGGMMDSGDMAIFEDRPPTLEDEPHKRSSPTVESFDDKARVEQCDTDVMMQLFDFVSRNDIELAEVRTEDEAPDIEEDISPSGEEESSRVSYEEARGESKASTSGYLPPIAEKSPECLKVVESENHLQSPQRSPLDSCTSPSKRDASSDNNLETIIAKDIHKSHIFESQLQTQSSLEVEIGSQDSGEIGTKDFEKEQSPLSFVEEEENVRSDFGIFETSAKLPKDSVNESCIAETDITQDQVKRSSYDAQNIEHDGISKDDGQQPIGERAHAQKTCIEDERYAQTSSKTESQFEFQTIIDESQPNAGCAFVNTAFAGAEAIDEVEHSAPIRARSPYEVVRDDITDPSVDEPKELPTTSAKSTYIMSKQIEMRHRPMLKHIPSEISEEDLVEREMSPVAKLEFEQLLKSGPTTRELLKAEMEYLTKDRTISSDVFQTTTTTSTCTSKTVVSLKSEDSSTLHMSSISHDDEGTTQDSRIESLVTSIEKETSKGGIKSSMNGPGEVEYQPEYDYNEETARNRFSETSSLVHSNLEQLQSDSDEKKRHYSSISDDVIDLEIGEILRSEQQFEDIIDRPVSPEPPKDEYTGILCDSVDGTKESFVETHSCFFVNEGRLNSSPPPYPGNLPRGFSHDLNFEKEIIETSDEAMDMDSDPYSDEKEAVFSYDMRFERDQEDLPCYGDLYTHEEEDEDALEGGERSKITSKLRKEPEFDILAGRKYFSRNLESDEASVSSLQEFEHLEEIVGDRKSSVGSIDSQNGKPLSKSGEHDDVSMSSLTEFERIEQECLEEKIDPAMQESRLSEIDEGHESQASEPSHDKSDNCKDEDLSIVEEYDHNLKDIDRIILKPDCSDDHQLPFQYFVKPEAQTDMSSGISSKVTKLISTITSDRIGGTEVCKSNEGYLDSHSRDDYMDQDSLHDELSLKPDSLAEDAKGEFLDSLHEERCVDVDSLQDDIPEGMRDSLLEDRQIEDDSLHEMDILPDESSLSMESSFAAVVPDSSKADNEAKTQTQQDTFAFTSLESALIHASKQTKTEVVISDLAPSDIMLSSTDSLEQSSSAAAAFHLESESAMSTSLTGVPFSEDNTLLSSTDTLEHEGRITFRYEDIPVDELEILVKDGRKVIVDSEGNIQTDYEYKHFLEAEENINNGISHTSEDFIETRIPTTLFQSPTSTTTDSFGCVAIPDELGHSFNATLNGKNEKQFHTSDPEVEIEEIHTTDEFGNPKVVRRMKKVIHTKKEQFSSSSSSENVEEKLKEFLREHGAGESAGKSEEVVQEERSIDDKGDVVLVRTVKQQMLSHPEVHSRTFTGSSAATLSKEYIEQFKTLEPMDEMCEFEKVDDEGNVVRVTQQVVIKPEVHSISFSGPNAHQQMEDYMKQFASASQNGGTKGHSKTFSSVQISTSEQGYIPSDSTSQDITSISHFIKTTTSSIDPEPVIVRTTTSTTVSSSTDNEKKAEESSDQTSSAV